MIKLPWVITREDTCGNPTCDGCNANDKNQKCWSNKEYDGKVAQEKLMKYLHEACPHAATDMGKICTQYPRYACGICIAEIMESF